MILSKRSQHLSSYSANSELAPSCPPTTEPLASPPTTPPRGHKHSLSKPMTWLNRTSTPKPTRISEPKRGSSLDHLNLHRCGPLGSGATVVRTPQEALSGSSRTFDLINEEVAERDVPSDENEPRPPSSPPLPPLPDISDVGAGEEEEEVTDSQSASPTSVPLSDHIPRAYSSGTPSPKPHRSSSRPTMLTPSRSVPAFSTDIDVIPRQPSFEAVLLSSIPDGPIDPFKLIVTLETCTATYRTSLRTIVSRPSHLSRYITSVLSPISETASVYSNTSDASLVQNKNGFSAVFRDHLASSGCLPQSSHIIHLFLDRPSAPYTHVLAYLRSLPEQLETLPRAVQQLGPHSPSHLESLLELCEEASYLGLDTLHKLCCREINRVHHTPGVTATDKLRGKTGSVRSFRTLVEQRQPHKDGWPSDLRASKASKPATRESSSGSSCEYKDHKYGLASPPPGWI